MVLEDYKDPQLAKKLSERIQTLADEIEENLLFMHVCGSHEWTISHYGNVEILGRIPLLQEITPESLRAVYTEHFSKLDSVLSTL